MQDILSKLQNNQTLNAEEISAVLRDIFAEKYKDEEIENFLILLSQRPITADEITGAARVLREKAQSIKAPYGAVDCCGTGGDQSGTYNISTATALVVAACGVPIAKHGNRSASSKSGAADVLEALGINLNIPRPALEQALKEFNFAFLMAPNHHECLKPLAPIRKKIGKRTIFNILGPLANPAGTKHQLIGVYDKELMLPMVNALKNLGTKTAWVVHGSDGLDEITITGPTYIATLDEEGNIEEKTITPEDFGLPVSTLDKLKGGDADENAAALRRLLQKEGSAYRDITLANAAAVLVIHGSAENLKDGAQKAAEAIDSGAAYETLKDYICFSRTAADDENALEQNFA